MTQIYLVQSTFEEEMVPIVFASLENAKTYVLKGMKLMEMCGHQRDQYSTSEFDVGTMMGVGRQWEIIYDGDLTYTISEVELYESCDHEDFYHLKNVTL